MEVSRTPAVQASATFTHPSHDTQGAAAIGAAEDASRSTKYPLDRTDFLIEETKEVSTTAIEALHGTSGIPTGSGGDSSHRLTQSSVPTLDRADNTTYQPRSDHSYPPQPSHGSHSHPPFGRSHPVPITSAATSQVNGAPLPLSVDGLVTSLSTITSQLEDEDEDDATPACTPPSPVADQDLIATSAPRRGTRGSTSSFKRSVSSLFKRANSSSASMLDTSEFHFQHPNFLVYHDPATKITRRRGMAGPGSGHGLPLQSPDHASHETTRSNSPPSLDSPLEMASPQRQQEEGSAHERMPSAADFKKNRASTGLTLRGRAIGFVHANSPGKLVPKRTPFSRRRSFGSEPPQAHHLDQTQGHHHHHALPNPIEPSPWPQMPDVGVGVKSRRLSLSLPDDFHVEVQDLQAAFGYQNKLLGRHGKHLGKGATSKVTLMVRKGFPGEMYAVKEFRNKSKAETADEYEKKVKSEYSIAKSLRHPNIVETVQLCTDHGRWNHVMEYCADGDLFQLVEKGYLKSPNRASDRLCLFKQIVQGVNYLHQHGIAHRDIKLENCLITNGSKLKITDFGVSEVFSGTHPGLREAGGQCGKNMNEIRLCSPGICGSEPYIAPEVLRKDTPYDPRGMDVWGTAVVMIFLTFGANIWKRAEPGAPGSQYYDVLVKQWDKWNAKHAGEPEDARKISDSDYPYYLPFDECVSPPALRRVLLMMLNPDPAQRATITEIANHRWVKNIECCQSESYDEPTRYIDASKKGATRINGQKKIFCHNHLPLQSHGPSLGKTPG